MRETYFSHRQEKLIRSLHRAKGRREEGLFVAEGAKLISQLARRFDCCLLAASPSQERELQSLLSETGGTILPKEHVELPDKYVLGNLSTLATPRPILALFALPADVTAPRAISGPTLFLDGVQDPGNLGTLLRTADWMGVHRILLSRTCVDAFSPKVVQASMGALAAVEVEVLEEPVRFLTEQARSCPIIGTFLEGEDILSARVALPFYDSPWVLVLGNEGKGISAEVEACVTQPITIPPRTAEDLASESLNVATAGAICLTVLRLHSSL